MSDWQRCFAAASASWNANTVAGFGSARRGLISHSDLAVHSSGFPLACIHAGMGSQQVAFASKDPANPAKFFILSCPAHATHPAMVATRDAATTVPLDARASHPQIHP